MRRKLTLLIAALAAIGTVTACQDPAAVGSGCLCQGTYYGTSVDAVPGQGCKACPNGTAQGAAAAGATTLADCNTCLDISHASFTGTTSAPACTCKDPNAIALQGQNCKCKANTYGMPSRTTTTACTACPNGSGSAAGSTAQTDCTLCADSTHATFTGTTAAPACTCTDPNATLDASGNCQCKANTYGMPSTTSTTTCTACPSGSGSAPGSTALANCSLCIDTTYATFTGTASSPACSCTDPNAQISASTSMYQCKAGYYGTPSTTPTSGCNKCPQGQTTAAGSTTNTCAVVPSTQSYILMPIVSLVLSLFIAI
ncbi:immobilization antigen (macronuclear) [Tetrahymena thermophila SB210]|uniref:Immobilization antigen n=1 Tax=Tetrahymena thermophila (strain SB210) TaxID=312017 RepID=Q23WX2_TETTS|nr:immobilization antigen [Tetrahymena thermophila SB210]EAS00973.1 immobilization antigen [Tetrahymena thermophila SB210]|eukprot:XP_001021218.1 immobilization antigen [Tetrahymena thermophila SB210]